MANCKSAAVIVKDIFKESGNVISQMGCEIAVGVGSAIGTPIDHASCLRTVKEAAQYTKKITEFWNQKIVGNKTSSLTIGPRLLTLNDVHRGTVFGPTQRTFISLPIGKDTCVIEIEELNGKAETQMSVCLYDSEMIHTEIASRIFNNTKDRKRKKDEKRTIKVTNARGKILVILLDGKSLTNEFQYKLIVK